MGKYNKKLPCHWNVDLSPRLWHKLIFICIFVSNVLTSIRVLISTFPRITRSGERQRELWWLGGDSTFLMFWFSIGVRSLVEFVVQYDYHCQVVKQEILREMRKEINKAKQEIIDGEGYSKRSLFFHTLHSQYFSFQWFDWSFRADRLEPSAKLEVGLKDVSLKVEEKKSSELLETEVSFLIKNAFVLVELPCSNSLVQANVGKRACRKTSENNIFCRQRRVCGIGPDR